MENFFDELSKQVAKAVSRRDALKVAGRGIFGLFLTSTLVGRLWGQITASNGGGIGTSYCGGVQKAIQLGFPDPTQYPDKKTYHRAIAQSLAAARHAKLITEDCSECILEQFEEETPIAQQSACGPVVLPTQSCAQMSVPPQEIQLQVAVVLALGAAPGAWSDVQQYELWVILVEEILGCLIDFAAPQQAATTSTASLVGSASTAAAPIVPPPPCTVSGQPSCGSCITLGVNYCGPTNSLEHPHLLPVASCLNEACFQHDNCYSEHCILAPSILLPGCVFTDQTAQVCDAALLAVCQSSCVSQLSFTDPLFYSTKAVCALATCFSGLPVCDTRRIECAILELHCALGHELRSLQPQCNQPAPECLSCHGTSPCGSLEGQGCCANQVCCPCGQTCAHGQCQCGPGEVTCGSHCCVAGSICCPGPTVDVLPFCCAAGQTCCGAFCCIPTH